MARLRQYFKPVETPSFKPEDASKPLTPEMWEKYNSQLQRSQQVQAFHADLGSIVEKPYAEEIGDIKLSHVFDSDESVDEFARFSADTLSKGLSAKQLLTLHRRDAMLNQAYEAGQRAAEARLASGKAGAVATGSKPPVVPDPRSAQARPNGEKPRSEMTVEDHLMKIDPEFHGKLLRNEVKLV